MLNDSESENDQPDISRITKKIHDHIDTRLEYLRLIISEKITLALVRMASSAIVICLFLFFFLFVNIAAGFWIGKTFDNYAIGFGIVALFYFAATLIYLALRKSVFEKKMANSIIKSLFEEEEEDEDEE